MISKILPKSSNIKTNNKKNKSLRFSLFDGIFASGMAGFTQEYFTPFLLILGATVRQIGILNGLPNLVAALLQLKTADIVDHIKSRKKIINVFVVLQASMLLIMAGIAFLNIKKPGFFIWTVIFFTSFGAIATPAWASIMSDLVDEDKRGEYFGWRSKILGFITVAITFFSGFILHKMVKINIFYGFTIIFCFAFIFRMVSWYFLKKMYEPPMHYTSDNYFTLVNFISKIKESNFAKFVLFVAMMNFSVNLAAPFFPVLMLRDLKFNYLIFTIITITATISSFVVISRWGELADKVGNLKIIRFVAPLIGVIPCLWIINRNPVFLIFAQIFSGFLWAGFNLCAANFIYDAVTPGKRLRCLTYFNFINGLALSAGALLGGILIQKLPALFGYKILSLFLISSLLRIMVGIFMPKKLKEVRTVKKISYRKLVFSVIGIKPLLGIERKTIRY